MAVVSLLERLLEINADSITDFVRLLAVPLFLWAAYEDIRIRRVPSRLWWPPFVLGVALLAWDGWTAYTAGAFEWNHFIFPVAISIAVLVPLAVGFFIMGGFGGADMKALIVIAVLFPTAPDIIIPQGPAIPLVESPPGIPFSMTVLTNGVVAGIVYPLGLALRNLVSGDIPEKLSLFFVGRPVAIEDLERTHGRLLETPEGYTRGGLDLDALRMYLAWRDCDLATLCARAEELRDPATLPDEAGQVGDGAVTDGGRVPDDESAGGEASDETSASADDPHDGDAADEAPELDDPWGARAFLEDIESSAYGTTPALLREGLTVITERDRVWVSPGIPFLVPLVVGLVVSLTYGDVLVALLRAVGLL
jgi:preflagellin peptidase FlaK